MELRLPSPTQLKAIYEADLIPSFPPSELKPLVNMEQMWKDGCYEPWCLFDGETILGEAFLWLGSPGWALLDYLCVTASRRSEGLGDLILRLLREQDPKRILFAESEAPQDAPDEAMARRRMGFYRRCEARLAGYDTNIFGAHYKTLYWAERPISDEELMAQHALVYHQGLKPHLYQRFVHIPVDPNIPYPLTAWQI